MASDNLTQLGKNLKQTQNNVDHSERRIAELYPMVERLRDELAKDFLFRHEFYIYHPTKHRIMLNLTFNDEFQYNSIVYHTDVPKTFTADDIGTWFPLAFFGDLNYEGGFAYHVIFSKVSTGSFDMSFKASFDSGEVDVTPLTTFSSGEILVPLNYDDIVSPPDLVIKGVYVYGRLNSLSGTLYISAATLFQNTFVYVPRLIGV